MEKALFFLTSCHTSFRRNAIVRFLNLILIRSDYIIKVPSTYALPACLPAGLTYRLSPTDLHFGHQSTFVRNAIIVRTCSRPKQIKKKNSIEAVHVIHVSRPQRLPSSASPCHTMLHRDLHCKKFLIHFFNFPYSLIQLLHCKTFRYTIFLFFYLFIFTHFQRPVNLIAFIPLP